MRQIFIADVKAGNHCPSILLTPEGMVQYYKDYIERGLLTEEQLGLHARSFWKNLAEDLERFK